MVVQPGFLPQRCHFLHSVYFTSGSGSGFVLQILLTGGHLCPTCSFILDQETGEWKRVGENNFTFSVLVFNLFLARLVIFMRPGPVMDVLRISTQRFSTFPNSISCTTIPRNSKDGKVRVLVAGGWSGHNIRTAEVNNFPGSLEQLY